MAAKKITDWFVSKDGKGSKKPESKDQPQTEVQVETYIQRWEFVLQYLLLCS